MGCDDADRSKLPSSLPPVNAPRDPDLGLGVYSFLFFSNSEVSRVYSEGIAAGNRSLSARLRLRRIGSPKSFVRYSSHIYVGSWFGFLRDRRRRI